jgi:Bacterial archaeo-eukaryotic release factor family 2
MHLGTLQDLYQHAGPFVTVHANVSRNTEDAGDQLDARWTQTRHKLEHEGIDASLIEAIGERLLEPVDVPGEARRTIIAADGEIVFDDVLAGSSMWPETVTVGELPDVAGWVQHVDGQVPFLLVVADREGADIDFYRAMNRPEAAHREVEGDTLHIHKYQGGGWSHRRFQQRSENQWESNAREVAQEVRGAVTRHRPRVVLLAGDERARTAIAGDLEGIQSEVVHVASGGRAEGSSDQALWSEVRRVLAQIEAHDQQQLTDRLEEKWGQRSGAALGVDDVIGALVQHKVDTLIVDLQKARDLTVDATKFPGLPIPEQASKLKELPADQVLVAAGAATDTAVAVLPEAQTKGGGVAALLRWDDQASPPADTV